MNATNFDWSSVTEYREPIWWAILGGIRNMGLPYPVTNIISSAIFFLGVHVLARRQPDPLGFLILLFPILIVNMPMSGIRQGAAIGLLCIAFVAYIDRRPIRYALWVVLAAGFHTSALIFILLLPLAAGSFSRNRLMLAAALSVPVLYLLAATESADIAISRYFGTGVEAAGASFRIAFLALSGLYFFLFLKNSWLRTWPRDHSIVTIGAIGMGLLLVLIPVSTVLADRFGYYFIPIQTMIFARIPFLPFRTFAALHSALPYLGVLLIFTVWTQLSWHFEQCYIPYQIWFFDVPGIR